MSRYLRRRVPSRTSLQPQNLHVRGDFENLIDSLLQFHLPA
jgi:hypothetical protein